MKKFLIASFMLVVFAAGAHAANNSANSDAKNHLSSTFKDAQNVKWSSTPEFIEANFTWNGESLKAYYNNEGGFVAVSRPIEFARLPLKALLNIHDKYADYSATEVIELNNADEGMSYYVSLENANKKVILQISSQGETTVFKKTIK